MSQRNERSASTLIPPASGAVAGAVQEPRAAPLCWFRQADLGLFMHYGLHALRSFSEAGPSGGLYGVTMRHVRPCR